MSMSIGHFGEIQYFRNVPQPVREFLTGLIENPNFTTCFGEGSAVILTSVDDLVNETEDREVESWILENMKPVADKDGYCRLFMNW